ncbi:MAG: cell division protein FtsQ/DivIB [Candidatus Aceula lacicola]|nr:cell division protein FtsQ/DivIB [Candidatus Aceula lacicola]
MARKPKRRKKQKFSFSFFGSPIIRYAVAFLFLAFIVFVSARKIYWMFKDFSYFQVQKIISLSGENFKDQERFSYLKGKNIFEIDLVELQKQLKWAYPQAERIRALRRLPDAIAIDLIERTPAASVYINRVTVVVDSDGFVVSKTLKNKRLPLISGIPNRAGNVLVGRAIPDKSLQTALLILKTFVKESIFLDVHLKKINVGNLSKIYCYFSNGIEIIVDQDDIVKKVKSLKMIAGKANLEISNIRYIDLRFKEPVIKEK